MADWTGALVLSIFGALEVNGTPLRLMAFQERERARETLLCLVLWKGPPLGSSPPSPGWDRVT